MRTCPCGTAVFFRTEGMAVQLCESCHAEHLAAAPRAGVELAWWRLMALVKKRADGEKVEGFNAGWSAAHQNMLGMMEGLAVEFGDNVPSSDLQAAASLVRDFIDGEQDECCSTNLEQAAEHIEMYGAHKLRGPG